MTLNERTEAMVTRYGEVCTKTEAGRIMGLTINTVKKMIADGRIDDACGGTMVDVRSLARYIHQPKHEDFEAKKRKIKLKYNSEFAV